MTTRKLIAIVVAVNLVGTLISAYGALTYFPCWRFARYLSECGWLVFAFPLAWLGLVAGKLSASREIAYFCLGAGILLNACLWGWTASRIVRAVQHRTS